MKKGLILVAVLIALSLGLTGCSYYRVTDPGSREVYYTKHIGKKMGGAVTFKDAVTRRKVTLAQSEVMKIKRDQFKAAGKTRETE